MEPEKLYKFEKKNNLFELTLCNIEIWHFIRNELINKILYDRGVEEAHTTIDNISFLGKFSVFLKNFYFILFKNPLLFLRKRDIIIFNHPRRVKRDDTYYCIYTDELINNLRYSYYVMERQFDGKHLRPAPTKNMRYLDYVIMMRELIKIFYKIFRIDIFTYEDREKIKKIVDAINEEFKVQYETEVFAEFLKDKILNLTITKKYYYTILKKVQPKCIIEVVHYSHHNLAINEAAHELGIPVIELQHGVLGKGHVAYNAWVRNNLPQFPDYIFLFGNFWKQIAHFPIDKKNLIVTGFPYLEEKVNSFKKNKASIEHNSKKIILFISQKRIGLELSNLAIALDALLDHNKYHIIYKLHPGEFASWRDDYPKLVESGIEVIDKTADIYNFFNIASYLVGVYSTGIFEGFAFGLKIFILKAWGHEYVEYLYEKNYATLVTKASEIMRGIKSGAKGQVHASREVWAANSMQNMIRAIESIISQNQ